MFQYNTTVLIFREAGKLLYVPFIDQQQSIDTELCALVGRESES